MVNWNWKTDGDLKMSPAEFARALKRVDARGAPFVRFLGQGLRSIARWKEEGPPNSVATLLQVMIRFGISFPRACEALQDYPTGIPLGRPVAVKENGEEPPPIAIIELAKPMTHKAAKEALKHAARAVEDATAAYDEAAEEERRAYDREAQRKWRERQRDEA